ncbi:DUF4259 domain-containing protein [Nonomuraea sp. NBC_01738]|uniref:DUF4259 domain-containing protein n=1 Tax=Nonomuraea sp. NBC_01738 TaxID=2976003 RepID=UPI002E10EE34|nr:DUF4259 domain-containing protein [Nonomuraea sp. NBC_01738]
MGTWDVGPFDSDSAADWCGHFHDAAPEQRPELLRRTLEEVAGRTEYLDVDEAAEAMAAAAIVAAQHSGPPITSPYAPDFLVKGGTVTLPEGTAALAVRALDRIVGEESEWRELWEDAGAYPQASAVIMGLRGALVT